MSSYDTMVTQNIGGAKRVRDFLRALSIACTRCPALANQYCEGNELIHRERWDARPMTDIQRHELLNRIIASRGSRRYLEIGVDCGETFLNVQAPVKVGVDPAPNFMPTGQDVLFTMESDAFFVEKHEPWDLVFVDGLHTRAQVMRDIVNALACLSPGGVVVVDDCNPTTFEMQLIPRQQGEWTGDVWRAIVALRRTPRYTCYTVDADHGMAILEPKPNEPLLLAKDPMDETVVSYADLIFNRRDWLGLVPVEEFLRRFPCE